MAPKGKTQAERLIVLETNLERTEQSLKELKDTMLKKFDSIENKIEIRNKIDEIHGVVTSNNQPKTALQKFGDSARNIRDIIMAIIFLVVFLGIMLKVDFSAIIK